MNMLIVIEDQFVGINVIYYIIYLYIMIVDIFMYFGVDIQCGKQWIERVGGGVYYKGVVYVFVWYIMLLFFDVVVFFMNL